MVDENHDQLAALRTELEAARVEADKRVEALKKSHAESKARAKAIIQQQTEQSRKKLQVLEEDARLRSDELSQLKGMLRQAEVEKSALFEESRVLKDQLRTFSENISILSAERDDAIAKLNEVNHTADHTSTTIEKERDQLLAELSVVKQQLEDVRSSSASSPTQVSETPQPENPPLTNAAKLSDELLKSNQRSESLTEQLKNAKANLEIYRQEHEKTLNDFKFNNSKLQESLTKAEARVAELQSELKETEEALQREQENVVIAKETVANDASNSYDDRKVLEAKVAEMERTVTAKQAEIGRVREKARTYLKELNAEKRTMEEKNKQEVDELQKQLDLEREKCVSAEQKAENASREIDNCLAVIRDKQKSMQMLRMNVNSEKHAAEEAKRETEDLRSEFLRYKERARLALQEKEEEASGSQTDLDVAIASVRAELEQSRKETSDLRKRVEQLKHAELIADELRERVERAETVADLLRKDASSVTTSANVSQIDRLQEKIAKLENELSSAYSATEDANSQHLTTKKRLDATEKALHAAELRAKNIEVSSQKTIDVLKARVQELEIAVNKAREAAASAQRTASAAAKALAFSSSPENKDEDQSEKNNFGRDSRGKGAYNLDIDMNGSRSTLAAVLEGHSDELGLSPRHGDGLNLGKVEGSTAEAEAALEAKDQQITVLTSQLAELGALFDEVQRESQLRAEQTDVLKTEVKSLDAKLASAEKLQNGAPFSYLRTIVVRYLETEDPTLLPVICNVLSFTDDEASRVKAVRGSKPRTPSTSSSGGYFSLPFLGS